MADIDFIQFRQGTPTARAGYVLASGEPGWDGDALYIGDGVTPGGKPAAGAGGGGGTVTSVALSMPATFAVTGSPITSGGTLTATYASQTAKTFFAAPNAAAGVPAFRAIAVSDVPTLNQSTTGSAAKLTTARTIALGGLLGGSASFDGSGNVTITVTLADGALSIAKTSGLQTALDAKLTDAPSDGGLYARKNAAWVVVPTGGSPTWGGIGGTLSAQTDLQAALDAKAAKATTLAGYGITDAATSAQGAKADTAVQPGSLATVATTGAYGDLTAKPTLGTAAATDATAYATAAQGAKADSAVQPAALAAAQQTVPATVVTANYTLSNADAGTEVQVNSAVAVTVTVPSTGVTLGNVVLVRQTGAGQVTISGSTVKSFAATTKLAGQNALVSVRFDSASAVYVSGELAAS